MMLLLFQANRVLELALHLEKTVIDLKMDALRMWNMALAGTAMWEPSHTHQECIWVPGEQAEY